MAPSLLLRGQDSSVIAADRMKDFQLLAVSTEKSREKQE